MENKYSKFLLLAGLFFTTLLVANIISVKVIMVWGIVLPAAVICYPWTYAFTDVINEVWGKERAKKVVLYGFLFSIVALAFYQVAMLLPSAPFWGEQQAFVTILGASSRIILASMIAYLISQTVDVYIFNTIKEKMQGKHLWVRNNTSTIFSQGIDTVIFISLAFWGYMPLSALLAMMGWQYVVKVGIAVVDTPLVYGLAKWAKS